MINRDNLKMVIANISISAIEDILSTDCEFVLIELTVTNNGYCVVSNTTNDIDNNYDLDNDGTNKLIYTSEVIEILESLYLEYVNDWLTVSRFNEFYNCDDNLIKALRAYFIK